MYVGVRMRKPNPIGQVTKTLSQVKCETQTMCTLE